MQELNKTDQIPDSIYMLAAIATVMSGHDESSLGMSGHHYERTRIILRKDIKEFLESEGLDINIIVNRLLENFILAYKGFWEMFKRRGWDLNPRTLTGRGSRVPRSGQALQPRLEFYLTVP